MTGAPHSEGEVLHVACRSTESGDVPVRFGYAGRSLKVVEWLDRWDGDDHRYFRVRTRSGGVYILRRDDNTRLWQIWFFEDGGLARALAHDGAVQVYRTGGTQRARRRPRAA